MCKCNRKSNGKFESERGSGKGNDDGAAGGVR